VFLGYFVIFVVVFVQLVKQASHISSNLSCLAVELMPLIKDNVYEGDGLRRS
jgi:hypothetical protein